MIDFKNASYLKLKPVPNSDFSGMIQPMFVPGEEIIQSFRGIRDGVVFTNKRIFQSMSKASLVRKRTLPAFRIARSRRSPLKLPVCLTWTASWNSGSPAWAWPNLNLSPMQMSPVSAA